MLQRNRIWLIITGLFILLPAAAGVYFWDQLPQQMALQFSAADGSVSRYRAKEFVVFGVPALLCFLHVVAAFYIARDPKRQAMGDSMYRLLLFICPVISWFFAVFTYLDAFQIQVELATLMQIFAGILVLLFGIFLPGCPPNPSIGFRFTATLNDETVWKKTHLAAGIVWIIAGVILIINAFARIILSRFLILIAALMIGIPYFYAAYIYGQRNGKSQNIRKGEEQRNKYAKSGKKRRSS